MSARQNYGFERRRKDQMRRAKQEEKRQRRGDAENTQRRAGRPERCVLRQPQAQAAAQSRAAQIAGLAPSARAAFLFIGCAVRHQT